MKKMGHFTLGLIITVLAGFLAGCGAKLEASNIIYHKGQGSIWQVSLTENKSTQLSSSGWYAEYSPDNSRIAFSEFYDNGIWVMNADGSNPVRVTDQGSAPSWSPDGLKLVYQNANGSFAGKDHYLWIINADGSGMRQLSSVNGSQAHWSPDGNQIYFHGEVNNGIWVINVDGSGEKMLYQMGGYPAISPDGMQIAYVDLQDWTIWVMNVDGTGQRKLNDHGGLLPTWSPDGTRIAYEGRKKDLSGKPISGIWVINLDGSGDTLIAVDGRAPDWSN